MRIFGLAGWSGSGKTTLLTAVIPELETRGLMVSTIKHAHHEFVIDRPGKDSWRHRQAGAREVHLRVSCPPTVSPCFYGVDTPTRSELIGSDHNVEEIRRFVEADSLGFLSLPSLRKAVGDDENHDYCYACYTGDYPTELVNIEELITARQKRH